MISSTINFFLYKFHLDEKNFVLFFKALFLTTIVSYINAIFPFLPGTIFGFNWSGIAWMSMTVITTFLMFSPRKSTFSFYLWLPWVLYVFLYILFDFTFIGFQLTIQYVLPVFMGIVASKFEYTEEKLLYLFQWLLKTIALVYLLFIVYYLFTGYATHMAATPMFFAFGAVIGLGLYFYTFKLRYLALFCLLFLMPFLSVTRMGMLAFGAIFVTHFANKSLIGKSLTALIGLLLLFVVLNSKGFQEKTFANGKGSIKDLSVDYYNNENINSSGRKSWQIALAKGLAANPIWGNGPRADAAVLGEVIGKETGEAHNDYMSVTYNYGIVGLSLLLFGFIATFVRLFMMLRKMKPPIFQFLIRSQLTLFIPFLLFMFSDNILKYTIWFPNYFFALMGICFSVYHRKSFLEQSANVNFSSHSSL